MSRTKTRPHTKWNPKLSDKPLIKRIREHPGHMVKKRLRLSVSKLEMEQLDTITQ
ncbi:hypothetical protein AB6735_24440 [Mucilaginibacter sp. RCC_168]|uniref:hypothetical protein n=1 Tax=Mucilaginibacter sp. RCC_168 TaxID=3239221 RepID=UPI0035251F43